YPFPLLVERLHPTRAQHNPIFQVTFAWDKLQLLEARHETSWETLFLRQGGAPFPLMMTILESSKSMDVNLRYNADLFDEATISRIAHNFQTLLERITAQPEQCIHDLPLLPETERRRVLSEWNDTYTAFDNSLLVHQLFEIQAARSPEATALMFGNVRVSYGELNGRANRLARYLRTRGVGPETRVAVCLDRTPASITAILGIVKAGGAYVPIDPAYPAERLAFMVADTE